MRRLIFALIVAACGGGGSSNDGGTSDSGGNDAGGSDVVTNETGPAPINGLRVFFSDLESGPNGGGQNGKGAFVTIWGNGFGATQGSSTVSIGGGAADNYPTWTSTKITFQLGAAAKTGDVVVHVSGKGDSNALPFTVRSGNVFFVMTSGDDTHDGSYATPWKTITKAKNSLAAGDVAYLGDGVSQTTLDNFKAALSMDANDAANSGTQAMPKALVAYPGAKVTVGVESGIERGILTPAITGTFDYWVISQLVIRGETEAIDLSGGAIGWRIVGNDVSCPNGSGLSGCITGCDGDCTAGLKLFGNVVHDAASKVSSITKYYHGIYFGSDHIELGWNEVRDGKTCRAIQFHDSQGPNQYDLVVHDNLIHGTVCDGLNFASVDPSKGPVVALANESYFSGDTTGISGTNNLLFGASGAAAFLTGTVTQDPMLVAPTTFDFHLKPGSPAADHGTTTTATTDIDGNTRPQGSAYDIGAYELVP